MNYRSKLADMISVGVTATMLVLQVLGFMIHLNIEVAKEILYSSIVAIAISQSLFEIVMILLFLGIVDMLWRPKHKGLLETTSLVMCSLFPLFIALSTPIVQLKVMLQRKHPTVI